jgi:translocation and assembly module TamA
MRLWSILLFPLFFSNVFADPYEVEITGAPSEEVKALLEETSQLIALEDAPPASGAALRRRGESDIPRLVKVLHSFAYYNAHIDLDYNFEKSPWQVTIRVDSGPVYPIKAFSVKFLGDSPPLSEEALSPKTFDVSIGEPALPSTILKAEETLLLLLKSKGYPFAFVEKRDVVADQSDKTVTITLYYKSGPSITFGKTRIFGRRTVKSFLFSNNICWKEGALFDSNLVEKTKSALEGTRLFSAVNITYPPVAEEGNTVPMTIQVVEVRHKTVGIGGSFSTQNGGGALLEWENRNFRGVGEKLRFNLNALIGTDLGQLQEASLTYKIPNFLSKVQDLNWKVGFKHRRSKGFSSIAETLSATIDRKIDKQSRLSYGLMIRESRDYKSDDDGWFHLFKTPVTYRFSNIDDVLEPTKGGSFNACITPTAQLVNDQMFYNITLLTATYHKKIASFPRFVIATKGILGSIYGTDRLDIPPSERFYAGSECTLRGYNYLTVSPWSPPQNPQTNQNDPPKPTGGRSMLIGSFELRYRLNEKIGLMGFYDAGNVYADCFPNPYNRKILQSAGCGLRYYTAIGPLRFDVAFPLNKRKIAGSDFQDKPFQFYFSIGQTF